MVAPRRSAPARRDGAASRPVAPRRVPPAPEQVLVSRFDTALGPMSLASSARGLLLCSLPGDRRDKLGRWLARHAPGARVEEGLGRNAPAVDALRAYLAGERRGLPRLALDLRGTEFQCAVWRTLARVPVGTTVGYGELAARAGYPGASRACGSAAGRNPLPLFVPCHRVIAGDGSLGGFGGGLALKRRLLALEGLAELAAR